MSRQQVKQQEQSSSWCCTQKKESVRKKEKQPEKIKKTYQEGGFNRKREDSKVVEVEFSEGVDLINKDLEGNSLISQNKYVGGIKYHNATINKEVEKAEQGS
jgi:hypothetical protein